MKPQCRRGLSAGSGRPSGGPWGEVRGGRPVGGGPWEEVCGGRSVGEARGGGPWGEVRGGGPWGRSVDGGPWGRPVGGGPWGRPVGVGSWGEVRGGRTACAEPCRQRLVPVQPQVSAPPQGLHLMLGARLLFPAQVAPASSWVSLCAVAWFRQVIPVLNFAYGFEMVWRVTTNVLFHLGFVLLLLGSYCLSMTPAEGYMNRGLPFSLCCCVETCPCLLTKEECRLMG